MNHAIVQGNVNISKVIVLLPILIFCLNVPLAYSQELTRIKAKEMIVKYHKYPIIVTQTLEVGSNIGVSGDSRKWLESLNQDGLINYTYHRPWGMGHIVSVSLTDDGKKYAVGNGEQKNVQIRIAEEHFIDVTGIRISGDKKEAIVEYTWKYANKTPFCKNLAFVRAYGVVDPQNPTKTERQRMVLWDDGWRIE